MMDAVSNIAPLPAWSSDTDLAKAKEIQRLAEIQLEDVISIATSGDSRAATLGAAMSAISAALLATAVTVMGFTERDLVAIYALIASSACFIVGAGLAVASAAPTSFHLRGYSPVNLIGQPGDEAMIVRWAVEEGARKLERNRRVLARAGRFMLASYAA